MGLGEIACLYDPPRRPERDRTAQASTALSALVGELRRVAAPRTTWRPSVGLAASSRVVRQR